MKDAKIILMENKYKKMAFEIWEKGKSWNDLCILIDLLIQEAQETPKAQDKP